MEKDWILDKFWKKLIYVLGWTCAIPLGMMLLSMIIAFIYGLILGIFL